MRRTMMGWVVTTLALTAVLAVPSDGHFAGLGLVTASWFLIGVIALGLALVRLRPAQRGGGAGGSVWPGVS